jgi:predicted metal-binding membrane protein
MPDPADDEGAGWDRRLAAIKRLAEAAQARQKRRTVMVTDTVTGSRATTTALGLTAALVPAAVGWVISARQMNGMNMGVATGLGSLAFFIALWIPMMAAMMLPGAGPALVRRARERGPLVGVTAFAGSYLGFWALTGLLVYAFYRPHGTVVAGVITVAAGVYELTPVKRRFREHGRDRARTGLGLGVCCAGSSAGLMLIYLVLGVMSIPWMIAVTVLVTVQKLIPARPAIDVPVAAAVVGLGIVILTVPSWIPGLVPAM